MSRNQLIQWNEQAGHAWVALQNDLDAQLEPFGVTVVNALALASGTRVLDVGCGAGTTSLMLAERVKPAQVVGVDISTPLLARARERAHGIANLRFELGDAQTFAFEAGAFDAIYSRFGVMFFTDPTEAFRNLRRALRPGGALAFVCWRAMQENPSFTVPIEAALPFLAEPPSPPDPSAPGPCAFADSARVQRMLEQTGFEQVELTAHDSELVFARELDRAVDVAMQIGPLGRALTNATEATLASVRAAVRDAFAPHLRSTGVTLPAATWVVTARATLDA